MDPAVKTLNNTASSTIGMKPKIVIELDTVPLDKKYPKETVLLEDRLNRCLYQPDEQHGDKKDVQQTLFGVKIHID